MVIAFELDIQLLKPSQIKFADNESFVNVHWLESRSMFACLLMKSRC